MRAKNLIFLLLSTLFLFSCANKNLDPTGGSTTGKETQTDLNMTIGYFNDDFSPSKTPTDIIALKYEGMPEGFDMIAQTLGNGDTRVILLDNKSQSTVAYDYKKDTDFPYSTYMQREETKTWGTITPYRENTKDFDVLWTLQDGTKESFPKIDYTDLSKSYIPFVDLDDDLNYKVKVIMLSLNILDAINTYITSSSTLEYYNILDRNVEMAGRGFLQGFLWIFAGVVTIAAVVVVPFLNSCFI